jgi:hypothetical protein
MYFIAHKIVYPAIYNVKPLLFPHLWLMNDLPNDNSCICHKNDKTFMQINMMSKSYDYHNTIKHTGMLRQLFMSTCSSGINKVKS